MFYNIVVVFITKQKKYATKNSETVSYAIRPRTSEQGKNLSASTDSNGALFSFINLCFVYDFVAVMGIVIFQNT